MHHLYETYRERIPPGICMICTVECRLAETGNCYLYVCPACGPYNVCEELKYWAKEIMGDFAGKRHLLSAYTREASSAIKKPAGLEILTVDRVKRILSESAESTVLEKLDSLLMIAARKSEIFGDFCNLDFDFDYPLLRARNSDEMENIAHGLIQQGLAKSSYDGDARNIAVTVEGWQRVQEQQLYREKSKNVFVAMSFSDATFHIFEQAIDPAIRGAGFVPIRVDRQEHTDDINDFIIRQIRASRFMVSDFTEHKNGVYFESGFMLGLERRVIWTCHRDHFGKTHFDTNHRAFIVYGTVEELRKKLEDRIIATEGYGPNYKQT